MRKRKSKKKVERESEEMGFRLLNAEKEKENLFLFFFFFFSSFETERLTEDVAWFVLIGDIRCSATINSSRFACILIYQLSLLTMVGTEKGLLNYSICSADFCWGFQRRQELNELPILNQELRFRKNYFVRRRVILAEGIV